MWESNFMPWKPWANSLAILQRFSGFALFHQASSLLKLTHSSQGWFHQESGNKHHWCSETHMLGTSTAFVHPFHWVQYFFQIKPLESFVFSHQIEKSIRTTRCHCFKIKNTFKFEITDSRAWNILLQPQPSPLPLLLGSQHSSPRSRHQH